MEDSSAKDRSNDATGTFCEIVRHTVLHQQQPLLAALKD